MYAPARSVALSIAPLLLVSVSAFAGQPKATTAPAGASASQAPCKSGDTVGFSCQMRDHRTMALCASPGFETFHGDPKDNPGYAYVRVGATKGGSEYLFPEDPTAYKKHMYFGVTLAAAPNMFIVTEKGTFLRFSLDEKSPVDLNQENLPQSWQKASLGGSDLCAKKIRREHLDPFMAQMMKKGPWEAANGRQPADTREPAPAR